MTSVSTTAVPIDDAALKSSVGAATRGLLDLKQPDGHFVFELEADATIPSEYVLLRHYLAEPVDAALEAKIAVYLRRIQGAHGGWPLVHDGPFDMSASVKAYFALKMIGDSVDAPHMVRAREAIRSRGGAINSNVFTRFTLVRAFLFPWRESQSIGFSNGKLSIDLTGSLRRFGALSVFGIPSLNFRILRPTSIQTWILQFVCISLDSSIEPMEFHPTKF